MIGGTEELDAGPSNARLLLRGRTGAKIEMSLATMAYNLKTMVNLLGAESLLATLS